MAVLSVVLAALLVQAPALRLPAAAAMLSAQSTEQQNGADVGAAQNAEERQQQQPQQSSQPQQKPQATAQDKSSGQPGTSTLDDIVSIDRIRKELERTPTLSFTMPDPNVPRYRVEIKAPTYKFPDFRQSFQIPTPPVSQPLGGSDYYEMQRLNTPPQFWGSAPFTNGDLLKISALTGAYGLAGALIRKGIEARQSAEASRVHQEVQQELADLAEHNARVARGEADPQTDKKADDKARKKADAAKKKKDEKKNDDSGGR